MACDKFEDLLHRHFDDALPPDEERHLMAHVETCRRCRFDLKIYGVMFRAMARMAEIAPPLDFTRSVMQAIRKLPAFGGNSQGGYSTIRNLVWAVSVAAVALAMVGGVFVWFHQPAPSSVLTQTPLPMSLDDQWAPSREGSSLRAPELNRNGVKLFCDVRNTVQVMRKGLRQWSKATDQTVVAPGDWVSTPAGFGARLVYPDQTWIRLKPGTSVQVLADAIRVSFGSTWIKVEKKGSKFEAITPNAVASVRGTAFTAGAEMRALSRESVAGPLMLYPMLRPEKLGPPVMVAPHLANEVVARMLRAFSFRSDFSVFESEVEVKAIVPETGRVLRSEILQKGYKVTVADRSLNEPRRLAVSDYLAWNLPPDPVLLDVARPASRPAASVAAEAAEETSGDATSASDEHHGPTYEALRKGR